MWQPPPACGSHSAHFGSSASVASLSAPARVQPDVCGWLPFVTLHVYKKLEPALPSSPILSLLPRKTSSGRRLAGDLHPASAREREQSGPGDQGVRWPGPGTAPSPRGDREPRAGHALSLKPLFYPCTTPCFPLLKIGGLAPNKPSTTPHKSSGTRHT